MLGPVPRSSGDDFEELLRRAGLPDHGVESDETELTCLDGELDSARSGLAPDVDPDGNPEHEPRSEPDDPALARLLPSGHRSDPDVAAEFRRLTEAGLRARKVAMIRAAVAALTNGTSAGSDKVSLDEAEATALMIGLNDVRLVLGERLGLRTDADADALDALRLAMSAQDGAGDDHVDLRFVLAAWYDFLTWLQAGLSEALLP